MAFTKKTREALRKSRMGKQKFSHHDDPYYQGDAARHDLKTLGDNPYRSGTQDHKDWVQGWMEAFT